MIRALGFVVFSFFPSFFSSLFYFPSENIVSVLCLFFSQSYLAVDSAVVLLLEIIIFGVSRFLWLISRIHSGLKILISSLLKKDDQHSTICVCTRTIHNQNIMSFLHFS